MGVNDKLNNFVWHPIHIVPSLAFHHRCQHPLVRLRCIRMSAYGAEIWNY